MNLIVQLIVAVVRFLTGDKTGALEGLGYPAELGNRIRDRRRVAKQAKTVDQRVTPERVRSVLDRL